MYDLSFSSCHIHQSLVTRESPLSSHHRSRKDRSGAPSSQPSSPTIYSSSRRRASRLVSSPFHLRPRRVRESVQKLIGLYVHIWVFLLLEDTLFFAFPLLSCVSYHPSFFLVSSSVSSHPLLTTPRLLLQSSRAVRGGGSIACRRTDAFLVFFPAPRANPPRPPQKKRHTRANNNNIDDTRFGV